MEQRIKASEFKAQCLQLMDHIAKTGEVYVITKNGKPVAQIGPVINRPQTLIGLHQSKVTMNDDLIEPLDELWEVDCADR